jgi:5-methylcytosine-specific restriction endonuclease McrA
MPKAYELPLPGEAFNSEIFYLGVLCKSGHDWQGGQTLRFRNNRNCPLCSRIDGLKRLQRKRAADPQGFNAQQAAYMRERRAQFGRPSRSKYGLPYTPNGDAEVRAMRTAIRTAGRLPSVARLVVDQQREHWRDYPADRAEFLRQYAQWRHHWKYAMSIEYRLYHRAKSKYRKARERGSRTVMLNGDQLWRRWVQFGHECAYCGANGDLQVEHVIPISKGGEHHLGNIVPACQRCNFSKGRANAEQWYRSQSFFSETRWTKLQNILRSSQPGIEQLSIFETPCPPRVLGPCPQY